MCMIKSILPVLAALSLFALSKTSAFTFNPPVVPFVRQSHHHHQSSKSRIVLFQAGGETATSPNAAPVLNGKRVLPYKVLTAGLTGHKVAAVFALLNTEYKRGYAGWEQCEHIGVSTDLDATLKELMEKEGSEKMAHVRAMSFVVPSIGAMESIADDWRADAAMVGGKINFDPVLADMAMPMPMEDDDDEDDYEEDEDDFMAMTAQAMSMSREATEQDTAADDDGVVSPFDVSSLPKAAATAEGEKLAFTKENVDKVLDEVRPYLISDGGNVAVDRVDVETQNVYLTLEGACGACPSSTVTMQMGIERVLKENFEDLGEVIRTEDEVEKPTELSFQVVEGEVNRIKPAIIAMGGSVDIVSVDPNGLVELKFKGAKKVRQGLELAIQDIDFVTEIKFLDDE